jgi:hypothetical protein
MVYLALVGIIIRVNANIILKLTKKGKQKPKKFSAISLD